MAFLDIFTMIILPALSVVISVTCFIVATIFKRNHYTASKFVELIELLPEYIQKAESMFGAGAGENKLNWVLSQMKLEAFNHGITVDDKYITDATNNLVTLTKNVNVSRKTPTHILGQADTESAGNNNQIN